jgi:putative membrane protein
MSTIRSLAAMAPMLAFLVIPLGVSGQDLSDPQIAHVAVTANAIDVELAEFALEHAQDGEVRAFARTMIRDHTAVNGQASALAGRLGVTPEDNDVSRSLRDDADEARGKIDDLWGASFDRSYIAREVAYHEAVLNALDGVLIPQADNAELKALLEGVRPAIAAHLAHARGLAGDLPSER